MYNNLHFRFIFKPFLCTNCEFLVLNLENTWRRKLIMDAFDNYVK